MTEATRPAAPEQISDRRAATRRAGRERRQGAGLDLILPYLLLAPSVLTVFGVLVYPLWNGLQASTKFYRYGRAVSDIGLDNYRRLWSDPEFLDALWITVRFVTISVAIETVLGFALALFCAREFAGIRLLRTVLIVPMVITPVVVAIVFRLIYANDAGMLTALSESMGGGQVEILGDPIKAFIGLIALDVWEWTPLIFLILLAGLQSLPQEPFEAAQVDGAGAWRTFVDLTLPMMRPVLAVAIVLRTIDAFGTFDQVFVLTQGGPGTVDEAHFALRIRGRVQVPANRLCRRPVRHRRPAHPGPCARGGAPSAPSGGDLTARWLRGLVTGCRARGRSAADLLDGGDLAENKQGDHAGRDALSARADVRQLHSSFQGQGLFQLPDQFDRGDGGVGCHRGRLRLARRLCDRALSSPLWARAEGRAGAADAAGSFRRW